MKVLYVGNYRDGTGWSRAVESYILALDAVGVDVVCRPVRFNNAAEPIQQRIVELEQKSAAGCTHVIQHVLPHLMQYDGHFQKCVALFASETSNFRTSSWAEHLNLMDQVVVINNQQVKACKNSGVTVPVSVVPHAVDPTRYQVSIAPFDLGLPQDTFVFYTVGEFVKRKNVAALIRAFHQEFSPNEPVELAIKTGVPGMTLDAGKAKVRELCTQVKQGIKLYPELRSYKEEIIITERLTDAQLLGLHAAANVFVMPSCGEAFCLPLMDALGMGRPAIVTDTGGMSELVSDLNGIVVSANRDSCFGAIDTFYDLYTGHETWDRIDIKSLQCGMRKLYESKDIRERMGEAALEVPYKYSYEIIGQKLLAVLEN